MLSILRNTLVALSVCFLSLPSAGAQEYPNRPVTIIVPLAAGGGPDLIARLMAQRLSEILHQPFVVENRPAGGGGIATVLSVLNAPRDGYTLLMADAQHMSINPNIFSRLPYDPLRDFIPISPIVVSYIYMATRTAEFGSFPEFVSFAKANPGKLNYGSSGVGSIHHIAFEALKSKLGLDIVHIPYRGAGQAVPALMAGDINLSLSGSSTLAAGLENGTLTMISVITEKRSPSFPKVPAVSEFVPNYHFQSEIGIVAPAGTPSAAIQKLSSAIAQVKKDPALRARLEPLGFEVVDGTPEEYVELIKRNSAVYQEVTAAAKIKVD